MHCHGVYFNSTHSCNTENDYPPAASPAQHSPPGQAIRANSLLASGQPACQCKQSLPEPSSSPSRANIKPCVTNAPAPGAHTDQHVHAHPAPGMLGCLKPTVPGHTSQPSYSTTHMRLRLRGLRLRGRCTREGLLGRVHALHVGVVGRHHLELTAGGESGIEELHVIHRTSTVCMSTSQCVAWQGCQGTQHRTRGKERMCPRQVARTGVRRRGHQSGWYCRGRAALCGRWDSGVRRALTSGSGQCSFPGAGRR